MTGPSRCVMCNEAEETMDHLLNQCKWVKRMWQEGLESFQQTRQETGSIQDIITAWESKSFKNPIVKKIWELLLGFTAWSIWKERNGHIFEGKTHSSDEIWKRT